MRGKEQQLVEASLKASSPQHGLCRRQGRERHSRKQDWQAIQKKVRVLILSNVSEVGYTFPFKNEAVQQGASLTATTPVSANAAISLTQGSPTSRSGSIGRSWRVWR